MLNVETAMKNKKLIICSGFLVSVLDDINFSCPTNHNVVIVLIERFSLMQLVMKPYSSVHSGADNLKKKKLLPRVGMILLCQPFYLCQELIAIHIPKDSLHHVTIRINDQHYRMAGYLISFDQFNPFAFFGIN